MAEVNTCSTRKRKLSMSQDSQESEEFVIIDEDEGVESSQQSQSEFSEPEPKVVHLETELSQSADRNLELSISKSQSSVVGLEISQTVSDDVVKQKLLELEGQVKQLKDENEILKSKSCSCRRPQVTNEEVVVTVTFNDKINFDFYKERLIKLFESKPELCASFEEDNLLLYVTKDRDVLPGDWVVVETDEAKEAELKQVQAASAAKKKKKCRWLNRNKDKKADKEEQELFVLDTMPSLSVRRNLFYESKFSVVNETDENENDKEAESKSSANIASCFNCNESHNLRDCPQPKNYMKINAARQKFKSHQTKTLRYHLEDDQRFAHLRPGKISEKLQKALGLRSNQLPEYIYRMRQLGYPPGWLQDVQEIQQSQLVLFDFQGKHTFDQKVKMPDLELDQIIEYSGFNVPLEKGVKDEHRSYGCPQYSKEFSKEKMFAHMQEQRKKAQDNLESCDMDVDKEAPSDTECVKFIIHSKVQSNVRDENRSLTNASPTLGELESKKLKLLAELTEAGSNSLPLEGLEETNENVNETTEEAYKTVDITGEVDEMNENTDDIKTDSICDTSIANSTLNIVRTTSFGTPILKSASPYSRLPNPDNFSQNVSQVINFENLPNSTGKYDQMVGVLEKVRKTLKGFAEQKS